MSKHFPVEISFPATGHPSTAYRRETSVLIAVTFFVMASAVQAAPPDSQQASAQAAPGSEPLRVTERPVSVAQRQIMIAFQTGPESPRVSGVDLWYTKDEGRTWKQYPDRVPATSPISFSAPDDGLYGFYIILHNSAGASSVPPAPGTKPQQSIRVDQTAPIVQVLEFRPDEHFEINREIHIRWCIKDEDLPDRPVELHFRAEQSKAYQLIADQQAPNSSYRWTVPEGAGGRIEVKITAKDRAGNLGRYVVDWLKVDPASGKAVKLSTRANGGGTSESPGDPGSGATQANRRLSLQGSADDWSLGTEQSPAGNLPLESAGSDHRLGSSPISSTREPGAVGTNVAYRDPPAARSALDEKTRQEAERLYQLGSWHRLRGEHDLAIERYQDALKLNSDLLEARNDLAAVLILQNQPDAAEREYMAVLSRDPFQVPALKGLAMLQAMQRNYASAQRTLERLLQTAPGDAEGWLYLGDVQMLAGERRPARESWLKAEAMEGAADVKQRAEKRLQIYQDSLADK